MVYGFGNLLGKRIVLLIKFLGDIKISKSYKKFLKILFVLFVLWFIPWVFVLYSGILFYFPYHKDGKSRYLRITGPLTKNIGGDWVPWKRIPRACKRALVLAEDNQFHLHHGISIRSIKESIEVNWRAKKILQGGSTITQQLVKNAFLSRDKSFIRKGREIIGALLADLILSKDFQILWYLNIVEYGPKIYGIKSAARYYYHKEARYLRTKECIALITVLPSPIKLGRSIKRGYYSRRFARRYNRILSYF